MGDGLASCSILAERLVAADDPAAHIPTPLLCRALDLLIALHAIVVEAMGSDPPRALRAASAAMAVAQQFPAEPLLSAQAHWSYASAVLYRPDYVAALAHYDSALEWYAQACRDVWPELPERDVPIVHVVRVFCLSELGRYHEALQAVDCAECWLADHPNPVAQLKLRLNQCQLALRMGNNAEAITLANDALVYARACDDAVTEAQAQNNIALASMMLGKFEQAHEALDASARAASRAGETLTVWRVQLNRALLFRLRGALFEALKLLEETGRHLALVPNEAAVIALDEAAIYTQLRQLHDAQVAAQRAAALFRQQGMQTYSAGAALQAVRIAVEQREESVARTMLAYAREQTPAHALQILEAELQLAEARIATLPSSRSKKATKALRQAARTAAEASVSLVQVMGLSHEAIEGQVTVATLAAQLGDVRAAQATYRQLLHVPNSDVQLIAYAGLGELAADDEALAYLTRAAQLAVERRRALPVEELQARYSTEMSPHHLRLASWHLRQGNTQQAFEAICIAKAGPLLDLRAVRATLDPAALVRLESAKAHLGYWRRQQQEHERAATYAQNQSQHEQAEVAKQLALDAVAHVHESEEALTAIVRTLGDKSGQAPVPKLDIIQQSLTDGTILLEYTQHGDELGCFVVTADLPVAYYSLGPYQELLALLDHWHLLRWTLRRSPLAPATIDMRVKAVLAPLRERLLAPLRAALCLAAHIVIAPWGVLHQVPWAALFDDNDALPIAPQLTITPSGALWATRPVVTGQNISPPRILAFESSGTNHLKHVAAEVAAIREYFPDATWTMRATAADLRALPAPRLLHIAAHGATNSATPIYSALELADGPFLLFQAHRLDLRGTQLVTLSACETGARPDYGDMVLALAGAFLCAGARAVVSSLWAVDDAATATLMRTFYARLAAGYAPSAALQQAQRGVRAEYPLDWAAFQLWAGAQ